MPFMFQSIDLNCDMGEEHPLTGENHDLEIMPFISSCNLSCGFHSGNPMLIQNTLSAAIERKLNIGAHPSYRDRKNFGRLLIDQDDRELLADIRYQVCALKAMCESLGGRLRHVKAHGALYNHLHENDIIAIAYIKLIREIDNDLKIMGLAGSRFGELCKQNDMSFIHECFADRRYEPDGRLRNRKYNNAVLHEDEELMNQVKNILNGYVVTSRDSKLELKADSICLHSDTSSAVKKAALIHDYLKSHHVRIHPHS